MATEIEPEAKRTAFTLNDTLLLAVVSGAAYAVVALFDAGYLRFYGLPADLNHPSAVSIFNVLGNMFRETFHIGSGDFEPLIIIDWSILVPLLMLIFPALPIIGVPNTLLARFPTQCSISATVIFLATPVASAPWGLAVIIIISVALALQSRGHVVRNGAFWSPNASDPFWRSRLWDRLGITTFRLALIALIIMPDAYYLGYEHAARQKRLFVTSGHSGAFVIADASSDTIVGMQAEIQRPGRHTRPTIKLTGLMVLLKPSDTHVFPIAMCIIDEPLLAPKWPVAQTFGKYFYVYDENRAYSFGTRTIVNDYCNLFQRLGDDSASRSQAARDPAETERQARVE